MISKYLINPNLKISEAMEKLTEVSGLGLVVVDENKKLLGSLTDGDLRRALMKGSSVDDSIKEVYNKNPKYIYKSDNQDKLKELTSNKLIKVVPIVDHDIVVDIYSIDQKDIEEASVVIMAGGLGSRLGSLTENCPKPMLKVGGSPVLERIIKNFTNVGFKSFYISTNYKAEIIEDYFEDGHNFNCLIKYLREDKRMGTAGSLSLLPADVNGPIIITNGDLLTLVDFRRLLSFHKDHESLITMCTRKYDFQVPFGVVNIKDGKAQSIDEKPKHSFDVNAGVYVINKEVLKYIPKDEYFDMPSLIDKLMNNNIQAECFPLVEQWIDIGQVEDLNYARSVYGGSND